MHLFLYGDDWVRHLSQVINTSKGHSLTSDYCEYPAINPLMLFSKVLRANVVMRVGVRPGSVGKRLFLLDSLWWLFTKIFWHKKFIYYWIGTDVLEATRDCKQGYSSFFSYAYTQSIHFSNAPWLKEELSKVGIESDLVLFPVGKVPPPPSENIEWPEAFTVVSYVPDGRHIFYGGEALVVAARKMPHIKFLIVGGIGTWLREKPANLTFLGFVKNMDEVINRAHVVIRHVEHDAIGGTVREGLFYARHVVYSYTIPYTLYAAWGDTDALCSAIASLYSDFTNGNLTPNVRGRDYALTEWNPSILLDRFCQALIDAGTSKKS